MAVGHVILLLLLSCGLGLNGVQMFTTMKRKRKSVYELLVVNSSFSKILSMASLIVATSLFLAGRNADDSYIYGLLWLVFCCNFNHMLCIAVDRLLIVKAALRYHHFQNSKLRFVGIAFYWAASLLFSGKVLLPTSSGRFIFTAVVASVFLAVCTVTVVIQTLVVRRAVSKQCIRHVLRVKNVRVVIGPCTPREKRILSISIWSIFPFIICSLPFCISAFLSYFHIYVAMTMLIDVCLLNPAIFLFFTWKNRESTIKPSNTSANANS